MKECAKLILLFAFCGLCIFIAYKTMPDIPTKEDIVKNRELKLESDFQSAKQKGMYTSYVADDQILCRLLKELNWTFVVVDKNRYIAINPDIKVDHIKLPR